MASFMKKLSKNLKSGLNNVKAKLTGKPQQAKLEDSNVAGIGSEENRALRKEAAQTEQAWAGAGQTPGHFRFALPWTLNW